MKKITRVITMLLVAVMLLSVSSVPAFAASGSALKSKAEKAEKQLVQFAEFYGWTATVGKTQVAKNKATIKVNLRNSEHIFDNIVVTATNKKVVYRYKSFNYNLAGWKKSLKHYAVKSDYKPLLKEKARLAGDALQSYAKARGWTIQRGGDGETYKNGKAYDTLKFENSKYHWTATVIAQRKKNKIVITYLRDSKSSDAKGIKSWLETYKVAN